MLNGSILFEVFLNTLEVHCEKNCSDRASSQHMRCTDTFSDTGGICKKSHPKCRLEYMGTSISGLNTFC